MFSAGRVMFLTPCLRDKESCAGPRQQTECRLWTDCLFAMQIASMTRIINDIPLNGGGSPMSDILHACQVELNPLTLCITDPS